MSSAYNPRMGRQSKLGIVWKPIYGVFHAINKGNGCTRYSGPNGAVTPLFMTPLSWHAPYEAVYGQPPPIVEADIRGTATVHRVERELSSFDSCKRIWQCLKNEWRPEQIKGALSAHLKLVTWFFFEFNLLISPWIYIAQSNWHLGFMDRTKTSIR